MQMSFRSTIRSMVRHMKEKTGMPKNWYAEKGSFARCRLCQRRRRCMLHALCKILLKTLKILKQAITDYIEFIHFLSKTLKMCMNYNVDSNSKYSN